MIESIEFTNFKALRNATLPLSPFTLLLGPNGSGKTTVLQALEAVASITRKEATFDWKSLISVSARRPDDPVTIRLRIRLSDQVYIAVFQWQSGGVRSDYYDEQEKPLSPQAAVWPKGWLGKLRTFALDPNFIAQPVHVESGALNSAGKGLAAVLDDLKDNHPERWDTVVSELHEWLPEYDHIQFDKPEKGMKRIVLRTKKGGHRIPAKELSQGTLVALALLTLAYLPEPPTLIGLEEIDRGLHPRLLRHLQDALYRLSYPESCGEKRPPIQVIATTHSPYLLDLYREHPEEVVLAEKEGLEVQFNRLSDIEHYGEILGDSPLSEIWYSGVLGGVSVKP